MFCNVCGKEVKRDLYWIIFSCNDSSKNFWFYGHEECLEEIALIISNYSKSLLSRRKKLGKISEFIGKQEYDEIAGGYVNEQ